MTTTYTKEVPEKCEASAIFDCKNADKTLKDLGVFYESVLPKREKTSRICESCHFKHGLGKYKSEVPLGQRFELQADSNWVLIEIADEKKLEEMKESVKEGFFDKFRKYAKRIFFSETAVACYYCLMDERTPIHVKISLAASLMYFISPWDLIPDILPIIGLTDDSFVVLAVVKIFDNHLKEEHWTAAKHFLDGKQVPNCICPYCASF